MSEKLPNHRNLKEYLGNHREKIFGAFLVLLLSAIVLPLALRLAPPDEPEIIHHYTADESPDGSFLQLNNLHIKHVSIDYSLLIIGYRTVVLNNITVEIPAGDVLFKDAIMISNVKNLQIINSRFICDDGVVIQNVENAHIINSYFESISGLTTENSNVHVQSGEFNSALAMRTISSEMKVQNTLFYSENIISPVDSEFNVSANIYSFEGAAADQPYFEYDSPYAIGTNPYEILGVWSDAAPKFPLDLIPNAFEYEIDYAPITNQSTASVDISIVSPFLSDVDIDGVSLNRTLGGSAFAQTFSYDVFLNAGLNEFEVSILSGNTSVSETISIYCDVFEPEFELSMPFSGIYGETAPVLMGSISDVSAVFGEISINGTDSISLGELRDQLEWEFASWSSIANNSAGNVSLILWDVFGNTAEFEFSLEKIVVIPYVHLSVEKVHCNVRTVVIFASDGDLAWFLNGESINISADLYEEGYYSFKISNFADLDDGNHVVSVYATLNGTTRSASVEFVKDTEKPEFILNEISINREDFGSISVLINGSVSDLSPFKIYLGSELIFCSIESNSTEFVRVFDSPTFTLRIVDAAGNYELMEFDFSEDAPLDIQTPLLLGAFVILAAVAIGSSIQSIKLRRKLKRRLNK